MIDWLLLTPPLLAYRSPWINGYSFSALGLLLPLAALLGRRYGVTGVISIAVGGLLFVPQFNASWGTLGGNPSLYLIGLAVAAMAAAKSSLLDCLRWPEDDRAAARLTFVAVFLLVLTIGTANTSVSGSDVRLSFWFPFSLLGYFLLFLMGARGSRIWALLVGLVVVSTLTWALALSGFLESSPRRGTVFLLVNVCHVATIFAALAAFSAGSATHAYLRGSPLVTVWRWPNAIIAALLVLWFGPDVIARIPVDLPHVSELQLLKVWVALPLAAFMAGLLNGKRGVIVVSAIVTVLMLAWNIGWVVYNAYTDDSIDFTRVPIDSPFVALAYAILGAKVAQTRNGSAEFQLPRVPAFITLVIVTALTIMGKGTHASMVLAGVFIVGSIALLVAAIRLRRAMVANAIEITADRWLAFATIVMLAAAIVANFEAVIDGLKQFYILVLILRAAYDDAARAEVRRYFDFFDLKMLALFAAMLAVYVIVLVTVIRTFVRTIPKIYSDTRKIFLFARTRWQRRKSQTA